VRGIFVSRRQLKIMVQARFQKGDERLAVLFHAASLSNARSDSSHADFDHTLVVVVVGVVRQGYDHGDFFELQGLTQLRYV
jgi:hypothetical protein